MDRTIDSIPSATMKALESWSWPGNVRELENFIERSVILSLHSSPRAPVSELRTTPLEADGDSTLDHIERNHIQRVSRTLCAHRCHSFCPAAEGAGSALRREGLI
jgi:formate hydrogenlyase transcriptional activator